MAFHRQTAHQDDEKFDNTMAQTTARDLGASKDLGQRPSKEYPTDEKHTVIEQTPKYDEERGVEVETVVSTAEDLVTKVIHVQDDPELGPWTFRMWFWGLGLSVFASVLQEIYQFKPQTVSVSLIFIVVISYVGCNFFSLVIPRRGLIGKWLNPFPFNSKEHIAIVIMANAAATSALATEVVGVQRLWYKTSPGPGNSIFLMLSSQLLGYGIAGFLRKTLIYPTKMLYPSNLPLNTLLETLHKDRAGNKKRFKFFWIVFSSIFVWEIFPEWIMPLLTGISIFCLAKRDSLVFTHLFGGTNGNEGLGLLAWCMDFNYVGTHTLWLPLQTITNNLVGYFGCIALFMGVYYTNTWRAKDFPFLSQLMFDGKESSSKSYVQYDQNLILNENGELDRAKLESQGLPYLSSTYVATLVAGNMAVTAALVHMLLWNYDDLKSAWAFMSPANLRRLLNPGTWSLRFWKADGSEEHSKDIMEDDKIDPHYKLMAGFKDVPNWWFGIVLLVSIVIGLVVIYTSKSSLPWWGYFISVLVGSIFILFFGALLAISGFTLQTQPVVQLIGAYCQPGRPLANMYFTLYGNNATTQAIAMLGDLKLAQYAHLPTRCTFTVQIVGTIVGGLLNYAMMLQITQSERDILLSIEGTNIWSGQVFQTYNTQAVAWGGLAKDLFSIGGRYQWVSIGFLLGFLAPFPTYFLHKLFPKAGFWYWNTGMICWYLGWLSVGINSSILTYFAIGFFSQFYLRKYHSRWFIKYNYLLSAAIDGGTQVMVFLLTFAVAGGSGKTVKFPKYWGNPDGPFDYCMADPTNAK